MLRPADPAGSSGSRDGRGLGCREVLEVIDAFVDQEVSGEVAEAVKEHLESCGSCREEHLLASRVREDLRSLGELDASAATLEAIRRATVGEEARPGRWRGSWARSWLAAAAAVVVIGLGLVIWSQQGPGPEQGRVVSAGPELTHGPEATPTADELAEARAQARLALSMVATVGRRAGVELHRDVVVRQLLRPAIESLERWREPIVPKGATGGGRADGHSAG